MCNVTEGQQRAYAGAAGYSIPQVSHLGKNPYLVPWTCGLVCHLAGYDVGIIEMLLMISGDVEPNPGPVLTIDDLVTVLRKLLPVSNIWYNIGLTLKLKPGVLNGIKAGKDRDCLREMLQEWLTTSSDTSWETLIAALRDPVVGMVALARDLEDEHCTQVPPQPSAQLSEVVKDNPFAQQEEPPSSRADVATSSNIDEPPPRSRHCSVAINGIVYSWGGESSSDLRTMEMFDGEYKQITTTGDVPVCVVEAACAAVGETIFCWGGRRRPCDKNCTPSNDLYQIQVGKWEWRKVKVANPQDAPPPKYGSRMVSLGDKLVVVGGRMTDYDYCTNDTHAFTIRGGMWSKPKVDERALPPIAYFSLTKVDGTFAILYGGYLYTNFRNGNIYLLDAKTWKYSVVKVTGPTSRSSHGACLVVSDPHPVLLVSGGLGNHDVHFKDTWVLEVNIDNCTATCCKVTLPGDTSYRLTHTTTTVINGASPMVVVDGGERGGKIVKDTVILTMAVDHPGGGAGEWRVREAVSAMKDPGRAQELMSSARVKVHMTSQDPQFPGTHFLGPPWKETVTSEGQEIPWDSIGLAFSIPPGAVPKEEPLQLAVRLCLTGPFQPPDQHQLTSPSYQISSSADFTKGIDVVVYHSVNLRTDADCERMTFLSAPNTPTYDGPLPQYKYQVLRGGVFCKNERFGTITLRQPSTLAIGMMGQKVSGTYSVRLYSNSEAPDGPCTRAVFCMVPCLPLYIKHLEAYMKKSKPGMKMSSVSIEEPVEFDDTTAEANVTLVFPGETPGYKIVPTKKPLKISRRQLDWVFQSSTELIDSYPKKLCLKISSEGRSATPPSKTWELTVLGLREELSFTLDFPLLPETEFQTTTVPAASPDEILNRILTVDDHKEVYDQLYPRRTKWKSIGTRFGLSQDDLNSIDKERRRKEQLLEKMIHDWLRRRSLKPTWQLVIDALNAVGYEGAAEDIRKYLLSSTTCTVAVRSVNRSIAVTADYHKLELSCVRSSIPPSAGAGDPERQSEDPESRAAGHLTMADFEEVQEALWDIRYLWLELATALELRPHLKGIQRKLKNDLDKYFPEVIELWLRRTEPVATWTALVTALKRPIVREFEEGIAEDIAQKYVFS